MAQPPDEDTPLPADDPPSDERLPLTDLERLNPGAWSWRRRLAQIALVLAVFAASFLAVSRVVFPPLPPAPVEPSVPAVLVSNVTYGRVFINGQLQASPPPLVLQMPEHSAIHITLEAPPFPAHTCTFQLPSAVDNPGACAFESAPSGPLVVHGVSIHPDTLLGIFFQDVDPASDNQIQQAHSAIDQAVSQSARLTVPSGSYIATGFQDGWLLTSERATMPLLAALLFAPASFIESPSGIGSFVQPPSGIPCGFFACPTPLIPHGGSLPTGQVWALSVPIGVHWRFTTAAGQVVGDVQFPGGSFVQLLLTYQAGIGWRVSPQMASDAITSQMPMANCATGAALLQFYVGTQWSIQLPQQASLEGCNLGLHQTNGKEAHFIWRFGVLLAADAQSHAVVPEAPLAPAEELSVLS